MQSRVFTTAVFNLVLESDHMVLDPNRWGEESNINYYCSFLQIKYIFLDDLYHIGQINVHK